MREYQIIGAVGRSDGGQAFAVLLLQKCALRRRETRAEQGVARAFAVDFLQKQQTATRDGRERALVPQKSNRDSTFATEAAGPGGRELRLGMKTPTTIAPDKLDFAALIRAGETVGWARRPPNRCC